LIVIVIASCIYWWRFSLLQNTKIVPADGGIFKEGIIGQPQSLNPLFSMLNDADRDVSELIFSGLLSYNSNGDLVEDLAKEYQLSADGKTYQFILKDDLLWSDNEPLTTDDIIFTIEAIKNTKVQSPLRLTWQDVKVEKIDEKTIVFTLKTPYLPFLENFTFKILPQHIFQDIDPQEYSLKPREKIIGSGPFKIKAVEKDNNDKIKKIVLERNQNFYGKSPFLEGVELTFVESEEELLKLKDKETALTNISPQNKEKLGERFNIYSLSLPRYFALFLNQENKILSQKEVREALAMATPKEDIVKKALLGEGRIVDGPLFEENKIGGEIQKYNFNLEEAKKKLEEAHWIDSNNDGIREKILAEGQEATMFELNLLTLSQPQLQETAEILKNTWQEIGVKLNIQAMEGEKLRQDYISQRQYDILLYAQGLYMIPDPSSFWHSTQKKYPGLNFSLYQQSETDDLLKKSIEEIDQTKRQELLQSFAKKLTEDIPAIFLYSPNFLYAIDKDVKGIQTKYIVNPSQRFINIENWYINEKRVPLSSNVE